MATAGTLLSDLSDKPPVLNNGDDDLVKEILADMNRQSQSNPVMNSPSPPSGNGRVINSPNPNTIYHNAVDPGTATAHLIGKDFPTASDFSNLMHSPSYHGGSQYAPVMQQPHQQMYNMQQHTLVDMTKGNMYSDIIVQIKQPLFVAIIVFIVSLPMINVLIGHYFPTLLRIGGDLTTAGLVVKSLIGGFLFWFIQKIIVPLMVV
jgi:hypothetical protein